MGREGKGGWIDAASNERGGGYCREGKGGWIDAASNERGGGYCREGKGGWIDAASNERAGGDCREGKRGWIDAASNERAGGDCRVGKEGLIDRLHVGGSSVGFGYFTCARRSNCDTSRKHCIERMHSFIYVVLDCIVALNPQHRCVKLLG